MLGLCRNRISRTFSKSVKFQSTLADLLAKEYNEEQSNMEVCADFSDLQSKVLLDFQVRDKPNDMSVLFERDFENEKITVEVDFDGAESINDQEEFGEVDAEENEEHENAMMVPIMVSIKKGNKEMEFNCVSGDQLSVESVRMVEDEEVEDEEVENAYEGPMFNELELELQDEFMDYLKERGIHDDFAKYISLYADVKEQKEYVLFLRNAKRFVK